MKLSRAISAILLVGMAVVPFACLTESPSEASSVVQAFRSDLLLRTGIVNPDFDQIRLLNHNVVMHYTASKNEDLWSICKTYKLDAYTIRSSNDLDVQVIKMGTELRIPSQKGMLYEVSSPENLRTISRGYERGKRLGNAYELEILQANKFPQPNMKDPNFAFQPGTVLFLPQAWKPTGLQLPFMDMHFRQTSRYGSRHHPVTGETRMHRGLDLAKPYGSPVLTSREGVVTYAGWQGGYGNLVEIRHEIKRKSGTRVLYTRYGHLSKILVREGQRVHLYQLIGRVGSTGISTGPHLHFEVRDENGASNNPRKFL